MKPRCSVNGCDRVAFCRGWCTAHYNRWQRGQAMAPPLKRMEMPLAERLWSRVVESDNGCRVWTGGRYHNKWAYGLIHCKDYRGATHRLAWILTFGEIPPGQMVLHRCDNPPCVNPDHLFLGTHADNMKDMAQKDRVMRGEKHPSAKLTAAQVREIRSLYPQLSATELGRRFGVSRSAVCQIVRGEIWKRA